MGLTHLMGELITLTMMSIALAMDAFSVSLGMGMLPLQRKQIFNIGLTIGLFHVVMPFLGIVLGRFIFHHFNGIATYIGGILLLILGTQMMISALHPSTNHFFTPKGLGLILFALTVSLDSFSVGFSLGIFGAKTAVTIFFFGFFSMILTWFGLILGKKVQSWVGAYGEALGGSILFTFGLKLLWPLPTTIAMPLFL